MGGQLDVYLLPCGSPGVVGGEHELGVGVLVVDPDDAVVCVARAGGQREKEKSVSVVAELCILQGGRLVIRIQVWHSGPQGLSPADDDLGLIPWGNDHAIFIAE